MKFSLLLIAISLILNTSNLLAYSGGAGTSENPYQITTRLELLELGNTPADCSNSFILMNDIDFGGALIRKTSIIPQFWGHFDGNDFAILNLTNHFNASQGIIAGFFGRLESAIIRDLSIENARIFNELDYSGILAASASSSMLTNCSVSGSILADDYIGGLVGFIEDATLITDCSSSVDIRGRQWAGGITALAMDSRILKSHASGNITLDEYFAGGICGLAARSTIRESSNKGTIVGINYVGGILGKGFDYSRIFDSFAGGSAIGVQYVGGMVGYLDRSIVYDSYSYADVIGDSNTYAFVGASLNYSSIYESFWSLEFSGQDSDSYATGLSTEEMINIQTFLDEGWDFLDIWEMSAEEPYFPVFSSKTPLVSTIFTKFNGKINWNDDVGNVVLSCKVDLPLDDLQTFLTREFKTLFQINDSLYLKSGELQGFNSKSNVVKFARSNPKTTTVLKLKKGVLSIKYKCKGLYDLGPALGIENISTKKTESPLNLKVNLGKYYGESDSDLTYKTKQDKKSTFKKFK